MNHPKQESGYAYLFSCVRCSAYRKRYAQVESPLHYSERGSKKQYRSRNLSGCDVVIPRRILVTLKGNICQLSYGESAPNVVLCLTLSPGAVIHGRLCQRAATCGSMAIAFTCAHMCTSQISKWRWKKKKWYMHPTIIG